MAKTVSTDEAVLAGLRKAVQNLPASKQLTGKEGVFAGGALGEELAEIAVAQGFLTKREEKVKKGKPKAYGVLTEKGIRRVLDADGPKAALEALLPAVQALGKPPAPSNAEACRFELARATEACVNVIKEAFSKLESQVLQALAPAPASAVDPALVLGALRQALERVKAPSLPAIAPPTGPTPASVAFSTSTLETAIVGFVDEWAKVKTVGCQFDALWNHLKGQHPQLTIGAFQDALRKLQDAGRIRLSGWPRMLDDIPQPQLALFISSKVMYYVQPAQPTG